MIAPESATKTPKMIMMIEVMRRAFCVPVRGGCAIVRPFSKTDLLSRSIGALRPIGARKSPTTERTARARHIPKRTPTSPRRSLVPADGGQRHGDPARKHWRPAGNRRSSNSPFRCRRARNCGGHRATDAYGTRRSASEAKVRLLAKQRVIQIRLVALPHSGVAEAEALMVVRKRGAVETNAIASSPVLLLTLAIALVIVMYAVSIWFSVQIMKNKEM